MGHHPSSLIVFLHKVLSFIYLISFLIHLIEYLVYLLYHDALTHQHIGMPRSSHKQAKSNRSGDDMSVAEATEKWGEPEETPRQAFDPYGRRLAEDNVNPLTAFCARALMLLIVVVVYTLTKMGKRSAMQRRHLSKTQVAF